MTLALAAWLGWLESHLVRQKRLQSGHIPTYGFDPCSRCVQKATNPCFSLMWLLLSLSLSFPIPLSKVRRSISPGKDLKKKKDS